MLLMRERIINLNRNQLSTNQLMRHSVKYVNVKYPGKMAKKLRERVKPPFNYYHLAFSTRMNLN